VRTCNDKCHVYVAMGHVVSVLSCVAKASDNFLYNLEK
jgi:hypothetical protein